MTKQQILNNIAKLDKQFKNELVKLESKGNTIKVVYIKKTNKDILEISKLRD